MNEWMAKPTTTQAIKAIGEPSWMNTKKSIGHKDASTAAMP